MQTTTDTPSELMFKIWPWLEANKNRLIAGGVALFVAICVYFFVSSQREQKEIAAGEALTELLMSAPNNLNAAEALTQLAAKHAGTAAAQRAELQAAASHFGAGRYAEAEALFSKFMQNSPGGAIAATAQLGIGASLEAQNKLDAAVVAYQKVASTYSATPSALPALVALGRIAEQQGKLAEAVNRYEAAARSGQLGGTLAQEAAFKAAELKSKTAAMTPATSVVAPAK